MNRYQFGKELIRLSELFKLSIERRRLRYNEKVFTCLKVVRKILDIDDEMLSKEKQISINFGDEVDNNELLRFIETFDFSRELNDEEYQFVMILYYDCQDLESKIKIDLEKYV